MRYVLSWWHLCWERLHQWAVVEGTPFLSASQIVHCCINYFGSIVGNCSQRALLHYIFLQGARVPQTFDCEESSNSKVVVDRLTVLNLQYLINKNLRVIIIIGQIFSLYTNQIGLFLH